MVTEFQPGPDSLLKHLRRRGVKLWTEAGKLRFQAPKGALTPDLRSELGRRKAEIIAFLEEARQAASAAEAPPLVPVERRPGEPLPTSFAQQRLWFLDQLAPGPAYNQPAAFRVSGTLDVAALRRSLREIVRRHEVLRTRFATRDGRPVQVIAEPMDLLLPVVDLADLGPERREAGLRYVTRLVAKHLFDLARGPLVRAALVRLDSAEHVVVLSLHHVVFDGWSVGVLRRELMDLYGAFSRGVASRLPELPVQYADFAVWQRRWLDSERMSREVDWWRRELQGAPVRLELPTDRPRPAFPSSLGRLRHVALPRGLTEALDEGARRNEATLFMALLAVFQVLLHRHSGQTDVVVGSPIAGRERPEIAGLIGFFVNTLALRVDLSGDPSFRDLLARVRATTLAAYTHPSLPFEKLVEELHPERSLSHNPLFQVAFALNVRHPEVTVSGLRFQALAVHTDTSIVDLTLLLEEDPAGGVRGFWEYSAELFDATTVARLDGHYREVLAAAVARPEARISTLGLLTPGERFQILEEWNATPGSAVPDGVHRLVARQAGRTPAAPALVDGDRRMSYRELQERSSQLAHRLRRLGVEPETRVALCFERSAELVVAALGVWKAGGAYVPLDPGLPESRLAYLVADSGARVVLARERWPETAGERLAVDLDAWVFGDESREAPAGGASSANLAYVVYTSGSTGEPKGVEVEHAALCNLVAWHLSAYGTGPGVRTTLVAGPGFDASVWEMWPALVSGASLHVADAATVASVPDLAAWLASEEIRQCFLPTPLAEEVLRSPWPAEAPLQVVLTGGDRLRRGGRADVPWRLVNHYGPTENAVVTTWTPVAAGETAPPIGRPLSGVRVYVLDRHLRPVPMGASGELLAGGASLARGYLGRPGLTAERFVPDPFAKEPGGRLYRTGDLVRCRADGQIDFLGRIDFQVKVRGFRIELGEVEAALLGHESVAEAVVLALPGVEDEKHLVAYVVGPAEPTELRAFLGERLPPYMVPAAFVSLAELPLTPNGKVDRRALPAPDFRSAAPSYVPPRTLTEETLAGIYSEVLGVERVGRRDDFFALGGHSLLATRLISRIREAFGVEVALAELFQQPRLHGLAAVIDDTRGAGRRELPPIEPAPRDVPLPLSFAQQRLWFLHQLEPWNPEYNIPLAIAVEGPLDVAAFGRVLDEVVGRHESLRTRFGDTADGPVQVVEPPDGQPLPLVDLAGLPPSHRDAELERRMRADAVALFDLAQGPLLRTTLLRLAPPPEEGFVFLLNQHHVVSDGWSIGVLVGEVGELYRAFVAGEPSPLPPLQVQYADFAVWQRGWLCGETLTGQLDVWRARLSGVAPLELPTDRPRPAVRSGRGRTVPVALPASLRRTIEELGRQNDATLFMTLLAAFQALLARYTGQQDIAVGTPIAGRRLPALEGLIGFFVNTLVLRSRFDRGDSFLELLAQVRETALQAYEHQDVPFEQLVEELFKSPLDPPKGTVQPRRDRGRTPLFQVMLALQTAEIGLLDLAGVTLRPLATDSGTSKVDLTLSLDPDLAGSIEYAVELFDETTILRLGRGFKTLLLTVAERPDTAIAELEILAPAERRQLLGEWNAAAPPKIRNRGLHELFEAQVERTADATALLFGVERLSYRELDRRANSLAHRLRQMGVGAEALVGVAVERSPEMVAALLGVWKAGGAYVPLDPAYPAERVAFMLEDAGAVVLITQEDLRERFSGADCPVVCLDTFWDEHGLRDDPPPPTGSAQNLAYVIYTSGSTGRAKGVAITHESALALVDWAGRTFPRSSLEAVLTSTSICFDLSVFELFVPLSLGGRLVLADNVLALPRLAARDEVTLVNTVPSAMAELLRLGDLPASVEAVNLAGEPLPNRLAQEIYARSAASAVRNLYGPSEDTTYSTGTVVEKGSGRKPSIGRPLPGTGAYVLDRDLRPVPVGVPGELYLGGPGLARGYLGRPALTAERFVPDPWSGTAGRLYRTGDLVRYLSDGCLDFLGRIDHQVKIRGFRLELGEVEVTLAAHPNVEEAIVLAREDVPGEKRLVAYVVGAAGAGELHDHLAEKLPGYMVPSAFVLLEEMPLLPNGKVDRRALPAPERRIDEEGYVPPRTPTEAVLAEAFEELLGLSRIGVNDDFFTLGGHSLLATRLVSRLRRDLGVELALADLFDAPRISELSVRIEDGPRAADRASLVAVPREKPLPLSFAQQRLWFLSQLEPSNPQFNMAAAVAFDGPLDVAVLRRSFEEVVRRHEVLRTRFLDSEDGGVQAIDPPCALPLPVVDLTALSSGLRHRERERLTAAEARRPFDLGNGSLLRAAVLHTASEEHVVLLNQHHVVSDGWSIGVLIRELAAGYRAFAVGERPRLPELAVQYADFAVWQRQWLDGDELERQLDWWRRNLAGAPPMELPADRPRPPVFSGHGARVPFQLPEPVAQGLEELARGHRATLFMVLLAAFQALLHRLSGQRDVVVGAPVAGRRRPEVEGLIGFFVNTLALRTDLSRTGSEATGTGLLDLVRAAVLQAFARDEVPFEKVVEAVQPRRDRSRPPLVQVVLALQNVPRESLELEGVTLRPLDADAGTTQFDLVLDLTPGDGVLDGSLRYATDLFDRSTVVRLGRHFETLVGGLLAEPRQRLSELPLLDAAERHQLLEWNDTPASGEPWRGFPEQVAEQAAGGAVALREASRGLEISYRDLDERSSQLAHRLRRLGVGPEVRVALLLERCCELVVAALAVWKAGGAYVPLDPGLPEERLAFLVADSGARVVLTRQHLSGRLPEAAAERLAVDLDAWAFSEESREAPAHGARSANLAYVIYTSGSTGEPKGVAVEHATLHNLVTWHRAVYGTGIGHRTTLLAGPGFDASVWEMWPALTSGARLHVVDVATVASAPDLVAWLEAEEVTQCFLPTPLAEEVLGLEAPAFSSLEVVLTGGDRLRRGGRGDVPWRLVNHYGPTENTVVTTWTPVGSDGGSLSAPPIGRPLPGVRVDLLDRQLRPVPIGVAGELTAAGASLVRGYLDRPGLTAERFVPDPLGETPGARLYRTGDLARRLPDGQVDFLGRIDFQVKVRGFRIELGEIESLLLAHAAVEEAVVVALPAAGDETRLVAYVRGSTEAEALRRWLAGKLPAYMLPSAFVFLEELPRTPNGKVDRRALPAPGEPDAAAAEADPPRTELERALAEIWCHVLGRETVGIHQSFFDLGGHSLLVTRVTRRLSQLLGRKVSPVEMFEHPTIASLARALEPRTEAAGRSRLWLRAGVESGEVAIVGMAGRFPGARDPAELWENLAAGREAVRFFTPEELAAAGVPEETIADPSYVAARAPLDDVELFDAGFFGFSPREAQLMDPQQRFFLEAAWEALEDAGVEPRRFPGRIAVYAGAGLSTYYLKNLLSHPSLGEIGSEMEVLLANDKDFLATLLSYRLDLKGPAMSVGTACSTSLVAVHQACQSLLTRECDAALAGGCSISASREGGHHYHPGGILSSDGHCRTFDAKASGTLKGDGVGVVVLKRLADAVEAGDTVHAVLKGTAVNNDGSGKIGFTAPSVEGQAAVIAEAQQKAGVPPETITYVEAHGTATPLGDPIEIRALTQAFRAGTDKSGFCAIGSVKSNLGHLDSAAGVTGLIKTVLALKHRQIPPSLHYETPNPEIDFATSPFYVNTVLRDWEADLQPLRAGVSSFGLGGTNAHAVVEEAPAAEPSTPSRPWQLLVLSARTPTALEAATDRLCTHLRAHPEEELADVAYTLRAGRRRFEVGRALVARDREDALRILEERDPKQLFDSLRKDEERPVVFLFPGQGSQHVGMAAELYASEPVFRAEVDRACELLKPHLGRDLREVIYPPEPGEEAAAALAGTALAQPALFVVEHALAKLWMAWGLTPEAMAGHSIGEYVAACLAGVFSLEDALAVVAERGRRMQEMPAGAMLAVNRGEEEVRELLTEGLEMAAVNAPERCVVSGPTAAVETLAASLAERGVGCRRLHTSHAFHSAMMEGALGPFREKLGGVRLEAPRIPFLSNVTGTWITAEEATDPGYWTRHLRATVRFADGVRELLREPRRVLLEVGPGTSLTTLAREQAGRRGGDAVASLPHPDDQRGEMAFLTTAAGRLWLAGVDAGGVGFSAGERRRRVSLPTYPFERRRYWIEPASGVRQAGSPDRKARLDQWFYRPAWKATPLPPVLFPEKLAEEEERWLVFVDGSDLAAAVVARLLEGRQQVKTVSAGDRYHREGDDAWTIDPRRSEDYRRLLRELGAVPGRVLHLWNAAELAPLSSDGLFEQARVLGYDSLLFLAQALAAAKPKDGVRVVVVASQLYDVSGCEPTVPERATLLGPLMVMSQEQPGIESLGLDLPTSAGVSEAAAQIVTEARTTSDDGMVAYRGRRRWARTFDRLELPAAGPLPLREGGVYLITGGLGNVGLLLAEHLARKVKARLVLLGRSVFPARDAWDDWLRSHGEEDPTSRKIARIRAMEASGAEVFPVTADVADREEMRAALAAVDERFGALHGVIHGAGVVRGESIARPLSEIGEAESRIQFRPKVRGLYVLEEVLADRRCDFRLLLSSNAAVLGGLGFIAYSAANAFLDAFAVSRSRTGGPLWISTNWDGWPDAEETPLLAHLSMTEEESRAAFDRVLGTVSSLALPQVIVATADLEARFRAWVGRRPEDAETQETRYERPELASDYAAPKSEAEEKLVEVWQGLLKISGIGVHDNFFDLGGNSLMAVQITSRVAELFGFEMEVRTLFDAPTVAELAAHVERESGREGRAVVLPAIEKAPRDRPLPLSFSQLRLWFLEQFEPGTAAFHLPSALRLDGRLDVTALRRSLWEVCRRHESLRTVFATVDGEPVQVVGDEPRVEVPVADLSRLKPSTRLGKVRRLATEVAGRPFDLGRGPLVRALLLRLGEEEHVLLFIQHHIISDGWSIGLLTQEIAALYEAFVDAPGTPAGPSPLPELALQYGDFAAWQRRHLAGATLESLLGYWREQLAGAPAQLKLPTDRPRPPVRSERGAKLDLRMGAGDRLRKFCSSHAATPFIVLMSAAKALLCRSTGQTDLSMGTFVANRSRPEVEDLIGFFVNTLVLRTSLAGDPAFSELTERLRQVALGAFGHQDLPFEKLLEEPWVEREMSVSPLFQTALVFQNYPWSPLELPRLTIEPMEFPWKPWANFDWTLWLWEEGSDLVGFVDYKTDLFDETTMRRFAGHYESILTGLLAAPEARLSELSFLSGAERHQLLQAWNDTEVDRGEETWVHERIASWARRDPDRPAVLFEDRVLSYGELDRLAGALAGRLMRQGVGAEAVVAILAERSAEMVVAAYAVLKTGGAYLPLDITHARDRIAHLLEVAGVPWLLTTGDLASELPDLACEVMTIEGEGAPETSPPAVRVGSENLAYVVYTSGSTGRPKGVMVTHGAWRNAYLAWEESYRLRPEGCHLQMASFSFDVFAGDFVRALCSGGRLVVCPRETLLEAPALYALMRRHGVDGAEFVPAVARHLMQHLKESGERLDFMRHLVVGSDVWYVREYRQLRSFAGPGTRTINSYGLSEVTIDSTFFEGEGRGLHDDAQVPIGRPFGGTRLYVLDRGMRIVPVGAAGELCLGGLGLARGYYGQGGLTAEKYSPDPLSGQPGARLYRTGDQARYRPDGHVDFLGRVDKQVKIRGFRIEPAEVEAVLGEHPSVEEAVVLARVDPPGGARLVAYVVAAPVDVVELRRFLKEKVPDYMVPSAFVALEALPLTSNGKVDRRRLPAPAADAVDVRPASTATEKALVEIFQEVTGVEPVGVETDFFAVGGHSLLATQVISRVRERLEVELPLRVLFELPVLGELAAAIDAAEGGESLHIPRRPEGAAAELSFAQQRLWVLDQLEPGSAAYNIPGALLLEGSLDAAALFAALEEVVRRHETLRTTFATEDEEPVQVVGPVAFSLPLLDLRRLPEARREAEVRRRIGEEANRPFDLGRGPVFRTLLLQLEPEKHALVLNMHHICSDAWSMGVFIQEMGTLYAAALRGSVRGVLPELPIQYADFAVWQRQWLVGEELERQLAYWREQLAGLTPLELPSDRPRPPLWSGRGRSVPVTIPSALRQGLEAVGRERGATLFMTLLGAFQAWLARETGRRDIVVGSPIAGRRLRQVESLIGFFVNTLALRGDVSPRLRWEEFVEHTRSATLAAFEYQDLPFEKLVEVLQPERDRSRTPLVQAVLVLQNAPRTAGSQAPGLNLLPLEAETTTAKFDLTLTLWEGPSLAGSLEYATDLFDRATVERWMRRFAALLQDVAENPGKPLADLSLLLPSERWQLLGEWSGIPATESSETIDALFVRQVKRTPKAVALTWNGAEMTYGELDGRSNQLARHLRASLAPEGLVGLFMDRAPEMIVAKLGILKAGGAYAPLDPGLPEARLALLLEDTRVGVVLTQRHLASRLPAGTPVLCLDEDWEVVAEQKATPPPAATTPHHLAYVMYTSGTTGRPKGVAVPHRAVVRLVRETGYASFGPDEVFLQLAPVSFDAATLEVWGPLLNGGRLVLHPPGPLSLDELARSIEEHGVTTLWLTAGLFHQMVEAHPESLARVRQVLAGGDVLSPSHVRALLERSEGRLINGYGPTENTTFTCCHGMRRSADVGVTVSIGRPIASTTVYLLDRSLSPVGVGTFGELYTGGAGLARGYLGRPGATAESFVPDPWTPGGRLYKTGDLARFLPDGTVEFQGRADQQVKLRGYRIELGEIEAVLASHEDVAEAVVSVREDSGDKRLVAYVVLAPGGDMEPLRGFLAERLPGYMVPAAFVALEELPLTPNGKVDRRALPAPEARGAEERYVAPATPVQEALAAIWGEILGVERVGAEDDFFELGGHSLLATRLVSRVNKAFRIQLGVSSLFDATTVAKMERVLIDTEPRPGQTEKVARLLLKVRQMSAEDLRETLARKRKEASSHE